MPIYMDRHDLEETVNAEHVARIHQEDLKYEHEFGCKGLTYWFDDQRKTAFCLIKAPNKNALEEMHNKAHGGIPHSIIEVDPNVVESFLGRIEDPDNLKNTALNIIDDPAFRVLMVMDFLSSKIKLDINDRGRVEFLNFRVSLKDIVQQNNGRIVRDGLCSLSSFRTISDAINCAIEVRAKCRISDNQIYKIKIGLSAGLPISNGEGIFEETIEMAERLCKMVDGEIIGSSEIKELCDNYNLNINGNDSLIRFMNHRDEDFINDFMDFMESSWNRTNLKVDDFSCFLGLSKSQLYRKIKSLTGKSLNVFIKEYRLQKAQFLLGKQKGNISEIAFDTGFNSAAYFSKCFYDVYGILPSRYKMDV